MKNLSPKFFEKLIAMCGRLRLNPADVLLLFTQESGLNPHNITSKTVGLNQFFGDYYKAYFQGTREEYAALSAEDQLGPIEAFFRNLIGGKNITSVAQLYAGNMLPISLKFEGVINKDRSTILATKGSDKTYPNSSLTYGQAYDGNSGLDFNKDGNITYGDLEDFLRKKTEDPVYREALQELSKVSGSQHASTLESSEGGSPEQASSEESDVDLFDFIDSVVNGMKEMMSGFNLSIFAEEENDYLIKISSPNLEDNLEVARILSTAYEDLLQAKAKTYTNGSSVEVSCHIVGENKKCFAAMDEFSKATLEEFSNKTNINNIELNIFANKKPSYSELDIKTAENNYRKFQLKILGIKNG